VLHDARRDVIYVILTRLGQPRSHNHMFFNYLPERRAVEKVGGDWVASPHTCKTRVSPAPPLLSRIWRVQPFLVFLLGCGAATDKRERGCMSWKGKEKRLRPACMNAPVG